jgi:hypothetical protein
MPAGLANDQVPRLTLHVPDPRVTQNQLDDRDVAGLDRAAPVRADHTWSARTRDRIFAVLLATLTVSINLPLLTRYPSPAADEASFVDAAVTFARHGVLGTDAHRDLLAGIQQHLYWQPPLYFVVLAGWLRLVGVGLLQARSFSMLCGVFVVVGVYFVSRRHAPEWPSAAAAALCAVSIWLMNGARLARMDTLCVALTIACVLSYERARESGRLSLFGLCGVLAALALLSHPLGLVAITVVSVHLLTRADPSPVRKTAVALMLTCFSCGVLAWLTYILRDPQSFQLQMTAQFARKMGLGSYWYHFWMSKTHVFSMLLVLTAGFWSVLKRWRTTDSIIALAFLVSFAAASYGRELQYQLYFYPWGCCAVAIVLKQFRAWRTILYASLVLAFVNDAVIIGHDVWRYRHRDYDALTRTVREAVPPGASVFIGFPDVTPYFALVDRNPMRIAVPVPTPNPDSHLRAAASSDFIVDSVQHTYLPELARLLDGEEPIAVVDQGPGYRLAIFRTRASRAATR